MTNADARREKLANMPVNSASRAWFLASRARVHGAAFFDEACFDYYQLRMLHCLKVYQMQLHAYVLLPDAAWLLLTPGRPKSMFSMLDFINGCYSEYFNDRFERDGAVFRNRPFVAVIDSAKLLLDCQKMIERWPLAKGVVEHPGLYRWSSYSANAFGGRSRFIVRHRHFDEFIASTANPMERYREFIASPFAPAQLATLEHRLLPPEEP